MNYFYFPSLFNITVGLFFKLRYILCDNEKLVIILQATALLQNNTLNFLSDVFSIEVNNIWADICISTRVKVSADIDLRGHFLALSFLPSFQPHLAMKPDIII